MTTTPFTWQKFRQNSDVVSLKLNSAEFIFFSMSFHCVGKKGKADVMSNCAVIAMETVRGRKRCGGCSPILSSSTTGLYHTLVMRCRTNTLYFHDFCHTGMFECDIQEQQCFAFCVCVTEIETKQPCGDACCSKYLNKKHSII